MKELYEPLKASKLWDRHIFILPHEENNCLANTKEIILKSDLVIAEVSYSSKGSGIELGWAESAQRKIMFIYKKGSNPSSSLKLISSNLILKLQQFIN
jgi:hypothetical protein